MTKNDDVFLTVPTGKWVHRLDLERETSASLPIPIAAYGLDSGTLILWSNGTHTMESKDETFPSSNWKVFE